MKLLTPDDETNLINKLVTELAKENKRSRLARLIDWCMIIVITVCFFQYLRGVRDEYDGMSSKNKALELRAKTAEDQLALMLKNGDCGILAWTFTTDMGPTQLRIVPAIMRKN